MQKRLRCYVYTRVSTAIQVDGYSLEAQREAATRYAKYQNMEVVKEFSDQGCSGKNINGRPEFKKMLEAIESGEDGISYVLVFKLSRFGRNAADVLNSLQLMQDFGVNLICVQDSIDSSKEAGKLMISVLSSVAEIERENILVQTMEGRRQKAREGRWNGGFAPYGYQLVDGELKIAEDEAEIIRIIFDKYTRTNLGANGVANYLNAHGYKKKQRQNNTLDTFSGNFVKGVLDNPIYMGKMPYGRRATEKIQGKRNEYHVVKQDKYDLFNGAHEAIISESDFRIAAQKREETGVRREKTYSLEHEHILSGILRCPVCGSAMYSNVNRKKKPDGSRYRDFFYYSCKHRIKVDGHNCSYHHQWGQEKVNAAVEEVICKLVNNEEFQTALMTKIGAKTDAGELEKEMEASRTRLRQVMGAKNKLAERMDSLDVTDKYYDRKYQDMQERMNRLYEEIGAIEEEIDTIALRIDNINKKQLSKESVFYILKSFDKIYGKFTDAEKKRFINSFVERVDIFEEEQEDGRFLKSIKFRFPVFYKGVETQEVDCTDCGWDYQRSLETVVLLSKLSEAKHHIEVKVDMDELDLTSAEAKATYKEIQDWVQEKYGFYVTNLNIAQVKQIHGIIERENYNKAKSADSKQPGCPEEKVKAIEDAMRHFQMI